jgi:hypothetical protein
MKQNAFSNRSDPAGGPEQQGLRRDPRRIERPGSQPGLDEDWPAHWAWEEDNLADGLGVGPFPNQRKPPKRADRSHATVPPPPDEVEDAVDLDEPPSDG